MNPRQATRPSRARVGLLVLVVAGFFNQGSCCPESGCVYPTPDPPPVAYVGSIAAHQVNPRTLFVTVRGLSTHTYTYEDTAIFRTDDAGATWQQHGNSGNGGDDLIADPATPGGFYVVRAYQGLFRFTDADPRLQELGPPPGLVPQVWAQGTNQLRVAIAAWQPGAIFYAQQGELARTLDGGSRWEKLSPGGKVRAIAAAPTPGVVYALVDDRLVESDDSGDTWIERGPIEGIETGPDSPWSEGIGLHPSRPNVLIVGTRSTLLVSRDRGRTFTRTSSPGVFDWHFTFDPEDPNTIYAMHSQLVVSFDGGGRWDEIQNRGGLAITRAPDHRLFMNGFDSIYREKSIHRPVKNDFVRIEFDHLKTGLPLGTPPPLSTGPR